MTKKKNIQSPKWAILKWSLVPLIAAMAFVYYFGSEEREQIRAERTELKKIEKIQKTRNELSKQFGPSFLKNEYANQAEMNWDGKNQKVTLQYGFDEKLQKEAEKLLKAYKPDYGSIVIMDAMTGKILTLANYEKGKPSQENLALRGTYPAASIFKIITAGAAVDKYKLTPDTIIMFNGGNHTLYKKNVMFTKVNKWTREITLREAFARSINTVFGRLTFEKLEPKDLQEYSIRFGFNKPIESDLPIDTGFTQIPDEKNFQLAEIASGYNKITRMSPVQGAMIAASVASGGTMKVPYLIESIKNEQGETIYKSEPVTAAVALSGEGAERLKEMMEATIQQGTSRKSFRPLLRDRKFDELELGGKTGSLQGDNPKGKVDWFVGYAVGGPNDRLAIAALTVNVQFWTVKASHLAQTLFKTHFKQQFSPKNEQFFNASNEPGQHR